MNFFERIFGRLKLLAMFPMGILEFCEIESAEAWNRWTEKQEGKSR